jgi:hypothetical protein
MLARTLVLSGASTGTVQALVCPLTGGRPLGLASCLSAEGSSPQWAESIDRGVHPCPRGLICCHGDHGDYVCSSRRVPMPGIDGLENDTQDGLCLVRMGACCNILSCQALNGVASQQLGNHVACLVLKSPRSRGGSVMNDELVKSYPFMIMGGRHDMVCS